MTIANSNRALTGAEKQQRYRQRVQGKLKEYKSLKQRMATLEKQNFDLRLALERCAKYGADDNYAIDMAAKALNAYRSILG